MVEKCPGRIVLSYHNSLLRPSDVELLDSNEWLNDNLIGFHFEYLENDVYPHVQERVTFISPEVTQLIKMSPGEELSFILDSLHLLSKDFIFMSVNNCESQETPGGSHWSLLVYFKKQQEFHHYDSMGCCNHDAAISLARKLHAHLTDGCNAKVKVIEEDCPQQQNSCDCGVYTICFAEHLCAKFFNSETAFPLSKITPDFVANKRTILRTLINTLGQESPT